MKRHSLVVVLFALTFGIGVKPSNPTFAQSSCQSPHGEIMFRRDGTYYRMNPDGSDIQKFPNADLIAFPPVWSPDGSKIAFMSFNRNDLSRSIYVMDSDGSQLQKITDVSLYDHPLAWSPDGTQLAFSIISEGIQVAVIDVDSGNLRQLTFGKQYFHLVGGWSPDGTRLVISNIYETSHYYLSVVDLESGTIRNLTAPENNVYDYFVGWMQDGENILFNSNRISSDLQLLSINIKSGEIGIVVSDFAAGGVWSPDRTQLAYVSTQNTARPNNNIVNISVLNTQTEAVTQVTSDGDRLNHENFPNLTWSPDGTQLAFESFVNGKYEIFEINVDGTNMTQLTFDGGTNPIWRPCP